MMVINFNSYYNHILKLINEYKLNSSSNLFSGSLLFKVDECLKNYNPLFEEYKDCIYNQEAVLFSNEESIVLFLLYSYDFEKILNCDSEIRCALVESFLYTRLNPYHYDIYLKMLLDSKIYKEIKKIEPFNLIYVLDKIIEFYDINQIKNENYDELKKKLCELNESKYSLYDEDYSLMNIYNTLKSYMLEEPFFGEKDHEILDYLLTLENNLDIDKKEELKQRISFLESKIQDKYDIAVNSLKIIKEYYIFNHVGLKLVKLPKEME